MANGVNVGKVYDSRLYFPAEDADKPYERDIMHPETNANQVLMPDQTNENGTTTTLAEFLGPQIAIVPSNTPSALDAYINNGNFFLLRSQGVIS